MGTVMQRLLLVVADGVRPDVLRDELDAGRAPAMSALCARGGLYTITSSFPSVTGPAYVPFLMGRHAATAGLPGLRWFDRARTLRWSPAHTRSYAGIDIWHVDGDVDPQMPTLFDLAQPSLSGMSMLGRGASVANIGRSLLWTVRAAIPHFRGDTLGWRGVERAGTTEFLRTFARERPRFSVLAITSPDKFSHKFGSDSQPVRDAIGDVDAAIARAQEIARRDGWLDSLRIWVVADHGHSPVSQHDDLHGWLEGQALRVRAHPRLHTRHPDVVLMVGGNAMAHLYVDPSARSRHWWPTHGARWESLHDALVLRDPIDLVSVSERADRVRISHSVYGTAFVTRREKGSSVGGGANGSAGTQANDSARWDYDATLGDPLRLGGSLLDLDDHGAWEACASSPYPDALVQLVQLCTSSRAGDLVLSAADGWDLRSRFEPVAHVSTHGALLRAQMSVPLLLDGPISRTPQRSADVMPSALAAMGLPIPEGLDGRSFL